MKKDLKIVSGENLHRHQSRVRYEFFDSISNKKLEKLFEIIENCEKEKKEKTMKSIIFCNTISSARAIEHYMKEKNKKTINLHSSIPPKLRSQLYLSFLHEDVDYLVTTDIASRGFY